MTNTRPPEGTEAELYWLRGYEAGVVAMRIDIKAVKAAAFAAGQKAVKVKPLVWDIHPDAECDPKCNEHYAGGQDNLAGVNEYCIYPHPCAVGMFVLDVMNNRCDDDFSTVESAKAAAQADYETRIRAALAGGE